MVLKIEPGDTTATRIRSETDYGEAIPQSIYRRVFTSFYAVGGVSSNFYEGKQKR